MEINPSGHSGFRCRWRRALYGLGGLVAAVVILSCASGGRYPYLMPSRSVTDQFESGLPPSGYRYFTTGSPYRPEALLGVIPELAPPAGGPWRAAPEDAGQWRQLVRGMQFFDEEASVQGSYGAILKLSDGRPVGIWYSARGLGTVSQDEAGRLWVWPPQQRRVLMFRRDF